MKKSKSIAEEKKKNALLKRVKKALDNWKVEPSDLIPAEAERDIEDFLDKLPPPDWNEDFKKLSQEIIQSVVSNGYKKLLKKYNKQKKSGE